MIKATRLGGGSLTSPHLKIKRMKRILVMISKWNNKGLKIISNQLRACIVPFSCINHSFPLSPFLHFFFFNYAHTSHF